MKLVLNSGCSGFSSWLSSLTSTSHRLLHFLGPFDSGAWAHFSHGCFLCLRMGVAWGILIFLDEYSFPMHLHFPPLSAFLSKHYCTVSKHSMEYPLQLIAAHCNPNTTSWSCGRTLDVKVSIIAYIVFNFVPCSALSETLPQSDPELADEAGAKKGCARCGYAFVPKTDQHGRFQLGNSWETKRLLRIPFSDKRRRVKGGDPLKIGYLVASFEVPTGMPTQL